MKYSQAKHNSHQHKHQRDNWGSRLEIIMAVAGSAVGLGNFLRFLAKTAVNGGGAFMIPYFVLLFLRPS